MSIPKIHPYPLSSPELNVESQVSWEPVFKNALILVHDMQNFFVSRFPENLRTDLIANCKKLIDHGRSNGSIIAYTAQPGRMTSEQRGLLSAFWGPGMETSNNDKLVVEDIRPHTDDIIITKWRYSAFFQSNLSEIIENRNIKKIFICGVYAHIGILTTALDAYSHNLETFLVRDAIADFSFDDHRFALLHAAKTCAALISIAEQCRDI